MATAPLTRGRARSRLWHSTLWSVFRFELGIQRREPATVLYALVFLLLTFAFVSSGTVELVRDRGTLPKLSSLAIALSMSGLTAFGQVITTMITASALLRDRAWRTDQLVFTTSVDLRVWLVGRWLAACTVMIVVYSALVSGVMLGALAPWVERDVSLGTVLVRALWPWVTLTLPTTLAIATVLTAVAARTQRLLAVLAAALLLLFLWQGCEAVWQANARFLQAPNRLVLASAMLDPFGTVALQVVTASWSDVDRATRLVPWLGLVGASRVVWLAIAGAIGVVMLRWRSEAPRLDDTTRRVASPPATPERAHPTLAALAVSIHARATPTVAAGPPIPHARAARTLPARTTALHSVALFTLRWLWRDNGWRVIAALGVLNVFVHAVTQPMSPVADPRTVVAIVQEHARLFLILLATVYAGELLWRDHDERVVELVHSAPLRTAVLVGGRVVGIALAQLALVAALLAAAWTGIAVRGSLVAPWTVAGIGALWILVPFIQWTLLSLCLHVVVQHKVIAHLLLIAGWVLAVALDANGATSPWMRFADPPTLLTGTPLPLSEALWRAAWWFAVSAALLALTVHRWRRVTSRR